MSRPCQSVLLVALGALVLFARPSEPVVAQPKAEPAFKSDGVAFLKKHEQEDHYDRDTDFNPFHIRFEEAAAASKPPR